MRTEVLSPQGLRPNRCFRETSVVWKFLLVSASCCTCLQAISLLGRFCPSSSYSSIPCGTDSEPSSSSSLRRVMRRWTARGRLSRRVQRLLTAREQLSRRALSLLSAQGLLFRWSLRRLTARVRCLRTALSLSTARGCLWTRAL